MITYMKTKNNVNIHLETLNKLFSFSYQGLYFVAQPRPPEYWQMVELQGSTTMHTHKGNFTG